jgi:hypothetical protein
MLWGRPRHDLGERKLRQNVLTDGAPTGFKSVVSIQFHVLTATSLKTVALWNITPCSLMEVDRCFRGTYCLHHQGHEWALRGKTSGKIGAVRKRSWLTSMRIHVVISQKSYIFNSLKILKSGLAWLLWRLRIDVEKLHWMTKVQGKSSRP